MAMTARTCSMVTKGGCCPGVTHSVRWSSPANVSTSLILTTGVPSGMFLWLTNVSTPTLTITDTGTTMLSGNLALGQYDTLLLRFDGTNWLQVSTSNN
jgi:hypothetical protein